MSLAINMIELGYSQNSCPFNNLIRGHSNQYIPAAFSGPLADVPSGNITNGWVSSLPNSGAYICRNLSFPTSAGTYNITWSGNITDMYLKSGPATLSSVDYVNRTATLTVTDTFPNNSTVICLAYTFTDTVNYPQNISVVKSGATGTFNSRFLQDVARFNGIRFVKWNTEAEGNILYGNQTAWAGGTQASPTRTILWANRNTTTGGDWLNYDGVPVEIMVELANAVRALNPNFSFIHINIPWNANDAWITGVATYVRDNLNTNIVCRFECSNEVWNPFYPAEKQAYNEGLAVGSPTLSGLGHGEYGWAVTRYAQRANEMMSLVTTVFSGQMSRVKRMFCVQHANSGIGRELFDWMASTHPTWLNTIDMLATAPYFTCDSATYPASYTGDKVPMFNSAYTYIDNDLNTDATTHKATATAYSVPYTTYESGPAFFFSDVTYQQSVHRDPAMYSICLYYLRWMDNFYSTAIWFAITHPIAATNAWGLKEYEGQTINSTNTPKFQAVIDYMAGG